MDIMMRQSERYFPVQLPRFPGPRDDVGIGVSLSLEKRNKSALVLHGDSAYQRRYNQESWAIRRAQSLARVARRPYYLAGSQEWC